MKSFIQKNTSGILILIILLATTTAMSGQGDKMNLSFEEIDVSIGRKNIDKLIDTYKEALEIGLAKESEKENEFYKNNAIYLFTVGGGCFGASPSEISIELEDNVAQINWTEPPLEDCPDVGIALSFYGRIIVSKKQYPNYKELKFKYYWE